MMTGRIRGLDGAAPVGGQAAEAPVLAVDLDRTLIRTDLLHEGLLAALARSPGRALAALAALPQGRAAVKARLADLPLEVDSLPLNETVLSHVRAARAAGARTALVSASDARLVRAVAARTGAFDEAHGSEAGRNLKGEAKAAFLAERFGAGRFAYMGDSAADLPVWRRAARAVTVGAGPALRRAAAAAAPQVEHLEPRQGGGIGLAHLRALRPHQWLKNILVFLPAIAAHATDPGTWLAALVAFLAFSLTASSVYVLNDLLDLSADRAHPRKCRRPFAAGTVPILHGLAMAPALLAAALLLALLAAPPLFVAVLGAYYALTLAYSFELKRRLVADIVALGGLYSLRILAGAAATGVPLSPWMLAFSGFLFLALAAVKRQAELVDGIAAGRPQAAGRAYRAEDLPVVTMMAIAAGYTSVLILALYISSPEVRVLYAEPGLLWGACGVLLYWISRTVMLAHRGRMTDDPIVYALRDPVSLASGAAVLTLGLGAVLM
jgi:4-hydroxybenzoate polyprenyltransferase/phosphoserine phosphatase